MAIGHKFSRLLHSSRKRMLATWTSKITGEEKKTDVGEG